VQIIGTRLGPLGIHPLARIPRESEPEIRNMAQQTWKDWALSATLGAEAAGILLFALPFTNVAKARLAEAVASNYILETLRQRGVYELAFLCFSWWYSSESRSLPTAPEDIVSRLDVDRIKRVERLKFCLLLLIFLKRSHDRIADGDIDLLKLTDQVGEERAFLDFKPPSDTMLRLVTQAYRACFDPVFLGEENIPRPGSCPVLYVSNHSILGFEYPVLLCWMYEKHRVFFRVLADHSHFQIPVNARVLRDYFGAVDGTRRNVDLLMERKEPVFVFPGGAREAFKRTTDDPYELFWDGRNGFVEMAIKWGAKIVPLTNVGTEDMVTVVKDLPLSWLPIPYVWGSDRTFPLVSIDRLERIYFHVGEAICTEQYKGDYSNEHHVLEVKTRTQEAIERGIALLQERRKQDCSSSDGCEEGKQALSSSDVRDDQSPSASLGKYIRSLVGAKL